MSPFTVRVAQHGDIPGIAKVIWEAFQKLIPRLRPLALEDPSAFQVDTVSRATKIINGEEGPAMKWLVATAKDSSEVAAIARWERVDNVCASPFTPKTQSPFGGPPQVEFFNKLGAMHRKVMADRPHFSLHILATLPAYQGQGAGSSLLRQLTAEADANSLPAYLEAAPGSVHVYEKFGFVGVDTITLPALPDRAEEWEVIMLREPKAPHGLDPQ